MSLKYLKHFYFKIILDFFLFTVRELLYQRTVEFFFYGFKFSCIFLLQKKTVLK